MKSLTHVEEIDWRGDKYVLEFFRTHDFSDVSPKTQSSAVCFLDDDHIVLFQHVDGYLSLPGGTIEKGETPEEALKREVMEEATCEILEFGPMGYLKTYKKEVPGTVWYQLRYWAKVNCLEETPDPDGSSLHRVIVQYEEAAEKLGWKDAGTFLKIAQEEYLK